MTEWTEDSINDYFSNKAMQIMQRGNRRPVNPLLDQLNIPTGQPKMPVIPKEKVQNFLNGGRNAVR